MTAQRPEGETSLLAHALCLCLWDILSLVGPCAKDDARSMEREDFDYLKYKSIVISYVTISAINPS